jgi:hypothetical protein
MCHFERGVVTVMSMYVHTVLITLWVAGALHSEKALRSRSNDMQGQVCGCVPCVEPAPVTERLAAMAGMTGRLSRVRCHCCQTYCCMMIAY